MLCHNILKIHEQFVAGPVMCAVGQCTRPRPVVWSLDPYESMRVAKIVPAPTRGTYPYPYLWCFMHAVLYRRSFITTTCQRLNNVNNWTRLIINAAKQTVHCYKQTWLWHLMKRGGRSKRLTRKSVNFMDYFISFLINILDLVLSSNNSIIKGLYTPTISRSKLS